MLLIRQVQKSDLDALLNLAGQAGAGLTTLPNDAEVLEHLIGKSEQSFSRTHQKPGDQIFLFVGEDLESGTVIGTTAIHSKVGGYEPFYNYQIKTEHVESVMLNVNKDVQYLQLMEEHNGPTEICTLFLSPQVRGKGYGKILSLCRFLFIAERRESFEDEVIVELRGVTSERFRSPFWDALGKHFFEIDFPRADTLSMKNKKFIAELMPRHPIYISMLPEKAKDVIGKSHKDTRPAQKILEQQGFNFNQSVDIFDAGPTFSCKTDSILTVRQSKLGHVHSLEDHFSDPQETHLISSTKVDCKICLGQLKVNNGEIILETKTALALGLKKGDSVRHAPYPTGSSK